MAKKPERKKNTQKPLVKITPNWPTHYNQMKYYAICMFSTSDVRLAVVQIYFVSIQIHSDIMRNVSVYFM